MPSAIRREIGKDVGRLAEYEQERSVLTPMRHFLVRNGKFAVQPMSLN